MAGYTRASPAFCGPDITKLPKRAFGKKDFIAHHEQLTFAEEKYLRPQ